MRLKNLLHHKYYETFNKNICNLSYSANPNLVDATWDGTKFTINYPKLFRYLSPLIHNNQLLNTSCSSALYTPYRTNPCHMIINGTQLILPKQMKKQTYVVNRRKNISTWIWGTIGDSSEYVSLLQDFFN